ncbi:MAG: SOS response-associated peptidase family protein [Alphaproteobacteria bacterium]|nr:SOS response-associated peptidase family protein [Alphaproteobacteria bacterium]
MCGKFTQMARWKGVVAFSQPLQAATGANDEIITATPMRLAHVLRLGAAGQREVVPMRWGFSDKRAANPARPKHMHVRAETIDTKPTFATAFEKARAILLVQTFNEGEDLPSGKTRQWVITPKDGKPLGIAVIWEEWVNGPERLTTFVMVTVPPNDLIAKVTDRMPAFLRPEDWSAWLGETGASLAEVKALLRTYEDSGNWEMAEQAPPRRGKPSSGGPGLFGR